MTVVLVGWFLFRVQSVAELTGMIQALNQMEWVPAHTAVVGSLMTMGLSVSTLEALQKWIGNFYVYEIIGKVFFYVISSAMIILTLSMLNGSPPDFIYFQF